jgi:hypothetical protein
MVILSDIYIYYIIYILYYIYIRYIYTYYIYSIHRLVYITNTLIKKYQELDYYMLLYTQLRTITNPFLLGKSIFLLVQSGFFREFSILPPWNHLVWSILVVLLISPSSQNMHYQSQAKNPPISSMAGKSPFFLDKNGLSQKPPAFFFE